MILPIYLGNASHVNQAAQLNVHGQPKPCMAMLLIDENKARAIWPSR